MLFFAVFLGFLAENYREHMIEEDRTEKHMHTMVQNLKYDTTRYDGNLRRNAEIAKGLDSFRYEIKQAIAGNVNTNKLYYYYWKYARGFSTPIINDAAISQLKSSGMLRMIKSDSLVNEIGDYYERRTATLNASRDALQRRRDELLQTIRQVFSFVHFDEFVERETTFSSAQNTFNETYFAGILTRTPALQLLPSATAHFEQLYSDVALCQLALRNFNSFISYSHQGADSLMKHINWEYSFEK